MVCQGIWTCVVIGVVDRCDTRLEGGHEAQPGDRKVLVTSFSVLDLEKSL